MELRAETLIGRYLVSSSIGAGGMGEVYRAHDQRLDRDVALKVLNSEFSHDTASVARFQKEAKAIAALSHPNIITIFDCDFDHDIFYIATELLEGETLREHIGPRPLPWRHAVQIALSIADALRCAHTKGIVHRDLKPENVFITKTGLVKILDFGLVRNTAGYGSGTATDTLTTPGMIVGTAGYMSPEQALREQIGVQSDIFSFGCVLYEMVSGKRAFERRTVAETLTAVLREEPVSLRRISNDVPEGLIRIVEHCLQKNPNARFQSASDIILALSDVEASSPIPTTLNAGRQRARFRTVSTVILFGVLAATIYLGRRATLSPGSEEPQNPHVAADVAAPAPPLDAQRPNTVDAPVNAQAYKLYKTGEYEWKKRTPDALLQGIDYFQRSVEIDPTYAPAYLGIANSYMLLGGTYEYLEPNVAMPKAREAALKALALNKSLAKAHATLGNIHHEYDWDWPAAEKEFKLAIELDPADADAHQWYGQALILRGRHEDGLRQLKRAEELDPLSLVAQTDVVQALWIAGDYDTAVVRARAVIDVEPRFWLAHWLLGLALFSKGELPQAADSIETALKLGGTATAHGSLAAVYARMGRRAEALKIVGELEELRRSRYVSPGGFGVAYAWLGQLDRAYAELERGFSERSSLVTNLNSAPLAEPIRKDPRYREFARRVGLPPLPN